MELLGFLVALPAPGDTEPPPPWSGVGMGRLSTEGATGAGPRSFIPEKR
jgi:hypothetical protein